jgi:carboxymethylenebutenolidase
MIERSVRLQRPGGTMETFIAQPGECGPFPGVILYMDMWGMRETIHGLARHIAVAGYWCAAPDLYYRFGRIRLFELTDHRRNMNFSELAASTQTLLKSAMQGLSDEMVLDDTAALLKFIDDGEPVAQGALGVVGYCMGGRHALCTAGKFNRRVRAAACLHGTDLVQDRDDSPHRLAMSAQGELYCGHAEHDQYAPPDVAAKLGQSLADGHARFSQRVHAGAKHSYAMPDRNAYDSCAADRDWTEIFAMFHRQLPHTTIVQ